jgi:hypothetical protein
MKKSKKKIMDISIDKIEYDMVFTQIIYMDNNNKMELYFDKYGRLLDTNCNLVGIHTPTKLYFFDNKLSNFNINKCDGFNIDNF